MTGTSDCDSANTQGLPDFWLLTIGSSGAHLAGAWTDSGFRLSSESQGNS
jgi:hypothetical protein